MHFKKGLALFGFVHLKRLKNILLKHKNVIQVVT